MLDLKFEHIGNINCCFGVIMNFYKINIFYVTLSFALLLPLFFMMFYPEQYNPDVVNYKPNYENGHFTYDYLYEWFSFFFREYIGLNFSQFWASLMLMQITLLAFLYKRPLLVFLALPTLIIMSQFFFGTQVRYSIAVIFLLIAVVFNNRRNLRILLSISSVLFHYGAFFPLIIYIISNKIKKEYFLVKNIKGFLYLSFFIALGYALVANVEYLMSFTRFAYYIGDSHYMQTKSSSSVIYAIISFFIVFISYQTNERFRRPEIRFVLGLLCASLITGSIMVLSGRILLVFFLLEPIILFLMYIDRVKPLLLISYLLLYISRCLYYLISSDFYFFDEFKIF